MKVALARPAEFAFTFVVSPNALIDTVTVLPALKPRIETLVDVPAGVDLGSAIVGALTAVSGFPLVAVVGGAVVAVVGGAVVVVGSVVTVGVVVGTVGVTEGEGDDAGLVPPEVVVTTEKVYEVPFDKPVISHEVVGCSTVQVAPPGDAVTVYVWPRKFFHGVHETVALPSPWVAETAVGAVGAAFGMIVTLSSQTRVESET